MKGNVHIHVALFLVGIDAFHEYGSAVSTGLGECTTTVVYLGTRIAGSTNSTEMEVPVTVGIGSKASAAVVGSSGLTPHTILG